MQKPYLFALWGGLFALCAVLGFIPAPAGATKILMVILSVMFFVPPALLLHHAAKMRDRNTALLVRNLSMASLALTMVLIVANFLSVLSSRQLGDILHSILVIVSTPMICSGYWALSLFLWACLMVWSIRILKIKKNP